MKTNKVRRIPVFDDHKFRSLIEKSSDVIVLIDAKAKILYASPSITRLYGRGYAEILGINGLKYVHPIDLPKLLKILADLIRFPKKTITADCRIKHKNGDWRWVDVSATNLLSDPIVKGIVVNFHDITDRKELEEKKDEFISIASHELKTPVAALKGYVQIIKKTYGQKDSKLYYYLEQINGQMTRPTDLINELLNVSRIQEGKIDLNKEIFDITNLIEETVDTMQSLTKPNQIIIKRKIIHKVNADKARITQVIINLISNAIKFSPKFTPIEIAYIQQEDQIIVSVRDYGIGISKVNQRKIFSRFFQENKKGTHSAGLGLGLYLSSMYVNLHGGKIWVDSQKNKGSTFSFSLPLISKV